MENIMEWGLLLLGMYFICKCYVTEQTHWAWTIVILPLMRGWAAGCIIIGLILAVIGGIKFFGG